MAKVIFENGAVLDGEQPSRANCMVAVDGERVVEVGASVQTNPGDQRVDLAGKTLMPGLVVGHYHAMYRDYGSPEQMATKTTALQEAYISLSNVQLALRCGYTSLISAGTHYNIDTPLADSIDAGDVIGPRLVPSGRNLMPVDQEVPGAADGEEACMCHSVDAFREGAIRDLDRGAQIIKIFGSPGHGATLSRGMSVAEIEAVVEVAHARGARVRAHVAGKRQVLRCVRAGVDIIDHADGTDSECIEAFVEHDCFVLPSIYLLKKINELGGQKFGFAGDLKVFDHMCEMIPRMVDAGVKLVPGDDFGVWQTPHGTYAEELVCYVDHAGITPLEAIKWATKFGGEMTGVPGVGTIQPGNVADLLIVDGDPSSDIRVLTDPARICAVIRGGRVVSGELAGAPALAAA